MSVPNVLGLAYKARGKSTRKLASGDLFAFGSCDRLTWCYLSTTCTKHTCRANRLFTLVLCRVDLLFALQPICLVVPDNQRGYPRYELVLK